MNEEFLDSLKWDEAGLIPAIAQQFDSGKVLMVAWMNREALLTSLAEGRAVYYSRSRKKLWRKGEESGHVQELRELRIDCDNDVVLMQVNQIGGIACHTGRHSCFYQRFDDGQWQAVEPVIKSADEIYGGKGDSKTRV